MRYMRLPFIYPYRSVNIKYANLNDALTKKLVSTRIVTPMPRVKNVDPELLKLLAPQSITTYNLPSTGGGGSVLPNGQPTPLGLQPGPADTALTRKEVARMINRALRKRLPTGGGGSVLPKGQPGMGFGGPLMWAALGSLGGVLLDRLLSSGRKKHEPSYYAPYIPGYRLY